MDLSLLPLPFYLSLLAVLGCGIYAWCHRDHAWGLPLGMVLGTTLVWYHGDAIYNDYSQYYLLMGADALEAAWWQVLLFIVFVSWLAPFANSLINHDYSGRKSTLMHFTRTRLLEHPKIQKQMDHLVIAMLGVWIALMLIALYRVDFNFGGIFTPYLTEKANPWLRGRIGGSMDAVLSLAGYVQLFLTAGFGVLAAVVRNPKTRTIAIIVCFLIMPFYLFDRTRNAMLATALPGILAWVFLRVRGGVIIKGVLLLMFFLATSAWFSFVISNRTDTTVSSAFRSEEGFELDEDATHKGISMFSELGYMNDFFKKGTYKPNWGMRYFAEVANVVPRAIWKDKPLIGIDYAIARGFSSGDVEGSVNAGVTASIATGMIGQGVVNFGPWLGPIAAALLMSIWVSVLARQDILGKHPARLLLYAVGMILTFNMGRDITLLVLYPYVFGWLLLIARDWYRGTKNPSVHRRPGSVITADKRQNPQAG